MIKLIASDLDGTLLGDDKVIPPELFTLVDELGSMGITFVAASGRSPYTLRANFAPVADKIDYICDNGAVAVAKNRQIFSCEVPSDVIADVMEFCRVEKLQALMCGSSFTYMTPVEGTVYEKLVSPYYFKRKTPEELILSGEQINKIAICDLNNPRSGSYERLLTLLRGRADATVSGDIWMDVMRTGVNKGGALAAIMNERGADKSETVAFGDYYNDAELLGCAGYAYVMKNANPDMFRFGNRIAESNNDGGVIKIIRRIVDGTFEY